MEKATKKSTGKKNGSCFLHERRKHIYASGFIYGRAS
jgi:hypothetical protein